VSLFQEDMSKIDFNNTELAFSYKSDKNLTFSAFIYRMVGMNFLVKITPSLINIAQKLFIPHLWAVKSTIFKQFCGGESIEECNPTIAILHKHGVGTILDYSVEGEENEANFDATKNEIIQTILKAKDNPAIPFSVFKITGLARFALLEKVSAKHTLSDAEIREWNLVHWRVDMICKSAFEHKVRVFIDAEESWIQQAIDDLADEMIKKYNTEMSIVYNTIQLYRHDRLQFLQENIQKHLAKNLKPGYKLVRGAYMEKEAKRAEEKGYQNPIQASKKATDADFDAAVAICLDNFPKVSICCGTHNQQSIVKLLDIMEQKQIPAKSPEIYCSQLLGMSDNLSFNLSAHGYNVAKYVPYGPVKSVLPYLIRRAQENTSIAGQMGRELQLLNQEIKRRNKKQ
jgi:proline dehydrogenase